MTSEHPIYTATMSAPTNIAVIKYWGKADAKYNTPINSSLSVTLDQADLRAVTTVAVSKSFTKNRLWLNGTEETPNQRFQNCLEGVRALATDKVDADGNVLIAQDEWSSLCVHVSSYNTFPTAAGLASSAAGYAALVAAMAHLMNAKEEYPGQLTTVARQGSGSACRSLYGGVVAWRMGSPGEDGTWRNSLGEQVIADWPELRALILVVSDQKKDTSSTAGMSTSVKTSTLLQHRAATVVPQRMQEMEEACRRLDFPAFGKITMQDSNQFHAVCLDTYPPVFYMNDISRAVIRLVTAYNSWAGEIRAAYTFDAGPNAVLYTLAAYVPEVTALMLHYFPSTGEGYFNNAELFQEAQALTLEPSLLEACDKTGRVPQESDVKKMYYTKPGPGPQVLTDVCNIDPATGLNCYEPKL